MILSVVLIVIGVALLVGGGELLVRGASGLAERAGLSPLIIGLTVVSAATSAPELAVTLGATLTGRGDIAIGNVVGSNIANVMLILGTTAVISPLVVGRQVRRVDVPAVVLFSAAMLFFARDGVISPWEGAILFAALVIYNFVVVRFSKNHPDPEDGEIELDVEESEPPRTWLGVILVIGGVALLVLGSRWLVDGASEIATSLGISELVVGLTVVAIGTSTPELAASIVAVRRGQAAMAVGNAIGSCLFNIGLVLGVPAMISGTGLGVPEPVLSLDGPMMLAAALTLVPMVFTGYKIARWEGVLLLALYFTYITYLVLSASDHADLTGFNTVVVGFVVPTVALGLIGLVVFEIGLRAGRAQMKEEMDPDSDATAKDDSDMSNKVQQ